MTAATPGTLRLEVDPRPIPAVGDVVRMAGFLNDSGDVLVLAVHDVRHLPGVELSCRGRPARVLFETIRAVSARGYQRADEVMPLRRRQPLDLRDVDGYSDRDDLTGSDDA